MTTAQGRARAAAEGPPPDPDLARSTASVGELVSGITTELGVLVRQELALAKAEAREEVAKAARAGAMLGSGGYVAHLAVLTLVAAAVLGLGEVLGGGWAALIVGVALAVVAAGLVGAGRSTLRRVRPKPERTVQAVGEDLRWARHPTR